MGLICLVFVLMVAGLVMFLGGWRQRRPDKREGRELMIGGAAVWAAALVILVIGVLTGLRHGSKEEAVRVQTQQRMKGIGFALAGYAAGHNDRLPPDLKTLLTEKAIADPKTLVDPRVKRSRGAAVDADADFAYAWTGADDLHGVRMATLSPRSVLLFAREPARDQRIALFADLHVEAIPGAEFDRQLRELNTARKEHGLDPLAPP